MGAPGSGKDTQVSELRKVFQLFVISSGDLARKLAEKNSEIKEEIAHGELLPDEQLLRGIEEYLFEVPENSGFIIDGFPRSLAQAEELESLLKKTGKKITAVLYLKVSKEELISRLSKRRVCPVCGYISLNKRDRCPKCDHDLIRRPDDAPEAVEERISIYFDKTLPLVQYFKEKGLLIEINGEKKVEDVTAEILKRLNSLI